MTIWMTDAPGATRAFLPAGIDWTPAPPEYPASHIFLKLAGGKTGWLARATGPDRTCILIDDAGNSQFDDIQQALHEGISLPDGLACLALTGSRFRGQRQRAWSATRGNLHLTSHYAVSLESSGSHAILTMIPAVAAAESIVAVSEGRLAPSIKWINDIWLEGAKVSGVLTATSVRGMRIEHVIFGIGMNVAVAPAIEPTPFVPRAGCLAGADAAMKEVLPELFSAITARLDELVELVRRGGGASVFDRYRALAGFLGAEVTIWPEGTSDWEHTAPVCRGRVLELHADLSLTVSGQAGRVAGGRMAFAAG